VVPLVACKLYERCQKSGDFLEKSQLGHDGVGEWESAESRQKFKERSCGDPAMTSGTYQQLQLPFSPVSLQQQLLASSIIVPLPASNNPKCSVYRGYLQCVRTGSGAFARRKQRPVSDMYPSCQH
jgi:hypothetical protein